MIDYEDPITIKLIKALAPRATEEEFYTFLHLCKQTGLDPIKKEVWFIKEGARCQIMTGINGYLSIANSHPNYDGMEVEVEHSPDGKPVKAIAKAYRKDRKYPALGIAYLAEYASNSPLWRTKPTVMLLKVAKSIALREAFPQELNGLYTAEEMPEEYSKPQVETPPISQSKGFFAYSVPKVDAKLGVNEDDLESFRKDVKATKGAKVTGDKIISPVEIPSMERFRIDGSKKKEEVGTPQEETED